MKNRKDFLTVALSGALLLALTLGSILTPDAALSKSERRPLQQLPALSAESVLAGSFQQKFENYALDQFPLREQFRTLKALAVRYLFGERDNNGIYLADGYLAKLDETLNADSLAHAQERFRYLYETYLAQTEAKLYLSIVPDKGYFLAEKNDYPALDYAALIASMREGMDYAQYIDLTGALSLEAYYRTDLHWRQESLAQTAQVLAAGMGAAITAPFDSVALDAPFYGVYYGQAALPVQPDTLSYLTNAVIDGCRVYDYETETYLPVYALDRAEGDDPYELFLSGSKSLLRIENPNAETQRRLLVFRDSFASSIIPLLSEGYSEITLVDIRYLSPALLGRFVDFAAQDDVLFLYSTSVLNDSSTIK